MKKPIFYILIFVVVTFSFSSFAKRPYFAYPDEITVNDIKYSATYSESLFFHKAYIEAHDIKSNELLWKKKIYSTFLNPFVEHDNQFVMIKKVSCENGTLIILNENKFKYLLDLKTKKLKKDRTTR